MKNPPSVWVPVANVRRTTFRGEDRHPESGTKKFKPGAKVWLLDHSWGDGWERVKVLGRHRSGMRLIEIVVSCRDLENWRARHEFNPAVVERCHDWGEPEARRIAEMLQVTVAALAGLEAILALARSA